MSTFQSALGVGVSLSDLINLCDSDVGTTVLVCFCMYIFTQNYECCFKNCIGTKLTRVIKSTMISGCVLLSKSKKSSQ